MISFVLAVALAFNLGDLKDSKVEADGICSHESEHYQCFNVTKGNQKYIVLVDRKGILIVYGVDTFKEHYKSEELRFLYSRNSI